MRLLMVYFLITFFSANCHAEEHKLHSDIHIFQGEKFEIELKVNCPKSELTCNDVGYNAINKNTGKKIQLKGQLLSNPTGDRQWYEFKNGKYLYELTADYTPSTTPQERWVLNVIHDGKYIASDEGNMY